MSVEVEIEGRGGIATEEMTLNMGPQHPSTHGVLRFIVKADGEIMRTAIPDIGYLHLCTHACQICCYFFAEL